MSKVTSKLQVTIPKAIAEQLSIAPGDDLEWVPGADSVRIVLAKTRKRAANAVARLQLFDAATGRQRQRELESPRAGTEGGRNWTREELYERGGTR